MRRVRIICLGSPFGDDQVGWLAAEALQKIASKDSCAEIVILDRPGMGLIQAMQGAKVVLLVDGVRSGARPGTLHHLTCSQLLQTESFVSSHDFGVVDAIRLGNVLEELPRNLTLLGVEIDDTADLTGLSPAVEHCLPDLMEALLAELGRLERSELEDVGLPYSCLSP